MSAYLADLYDQNATDPARPTVLRPTLGTSLRADTGDQALHAARQFLAANDWAVLCRVRRGDGQLVGWLTPEDFRHGDCADRIGRVQHLHQPVLDGLPPGLTAGDVCREDGRPWPCPTERAIRPHPPYGPSST